MTDFLAQAQDVCKYNQQHLQEIAPVIKQAFPDQLGAFINKNT
jgi:hypothetical protein